MVRTITRYEYNMSKRHNYAGTVRTLETSTVETWKEKNTEWDGKYWQMWMEPGKGTTLGPINIRG